MIRCFYELCIYQRDRVCCRNDTDIGPHGECRGAQVVALTPEQLAALKYDDPRALSPEDTARAWKEWE